MEEKLFEISLEILDYVSAVVAGGFAAGALVVSAASLIVSGFKALLKLAGGR